MKSDDKKKMYDILGIKSVYMEEMYERTDSEKKTIYVVMILYVKGVEEQMIKDIERVEEILSSKEKFLENIWGVKFELGILDIVTRLTKTTNYSAYVIKNTIGISREYATN